MDTRTGRVFSEDELKQHLGAFTGTARRVEKKNFRRFSVGEELTVKGMRFQIAEVEDRRIVLNFSGS
jgi:hypothetical protein